MTRFYADSAEFVKRLSPRVNILRLSSPLASRLIKTLLELWLWHSIPHEQESIRVESDQHQTWGKDKNFNTLIIQLYCVWQFSAFQKDLSLDDFVAKLVTTSLEGKVKVLHKYEHIVHGIGVKIPDHLVDVVSLTQTKNENNYTFILHFKRSVLVKAFPSSVIKVLRSSLQVNKIH